MMALAGLSDEWDAWRREHPHGSAGEFFAARLDAPGGIEAISSALTAAITARAGAGRGR